MYIYIISNKAFPGWYKIGRTLYPERRLGQYQTYSPYRDYVMNYLIIVEDPEIHENQFKDDSEGEWIRAKLETLIKKINKLEFGKESSSYIEVLHTNKKLYSDVKKNIYTKSK